MDPDIVGLVEPHTGELKTASEWSKTHPELEGLILESFSYCVNNSEQCEFTNLDIRLE